MNQPKDYNDDVESEDRPALDTYRYQQIPSTPSLRMTAEDLQSEEGEIRALEQKKRALEERVTGMEKDIGGLMR